MAIAKISSKNQITIPKTILDVLRLRRGERVLVEPREGGVLLRPLKKNARPVSLAEYYRGYAKETWKKLGGGERYLKRERMSWDR